MSTVYPTYDHAYYLARARHYARAAEHEPDMAIREALRRVERECRRRAEGAEQQTRLDG